MRTVPGSEDIGWLCGGAWGIKDCSPQMPKATRGLCPEKPLPGKGLWLLLFPKVLFSETGFFFPTMVSSPPTSVPRALWLQQLTLGGAHFRARLSCLPSTLMSAL